MGSGRACKYITLGLSSYNAYNFPSYQLLVRCIHTLGIVSLDYD